ncbi:MAG: hypothetical protein AB9897_01205 [Anaerolineaceae bacterium]
MRTQSYVLEEEQIAWITKKAKESGKTSGSAVVRGVLSTAIATEKRMLAVQGLDGILKVDPSFVTPVQVPSTEQFKST